jgi:hypothetical protein
MNRNKTKLKGAAQCMYSFKLLGQKITPRG